MCQPARIEPQMSSDELLAWLREAPDRDAYQKAPGHMADRTAAFSYGRSVALWWVFLMAWD